MAAHFSILAWKIPRTEEPGRLQSTRSLRIGHDWATSLSLFTFMLWRNGNPLQCSCLENPRDRGAWWAAVYGLAQSRTLLKWLSSGINNFNKINNKNLTDPRNSSNSKNNKTNNPSISRHNLYTLITTQMKDKIFKTVTETKCITYKQIKRKIIVDFFHLWMIIEWICCQIGTVENIDTTENSFRHWEIGQKPGPVERNKEC